MKFDFTKKKRRGKSPLWRRWFAWRPVKLYDGRYVWMETIERRFSYQAHLDNGFILSPYVAVYRPLVDITR